jgi:thiosulfate/3-mercaptopyruvate sulfurtransferase
VEPLAPHEKIWVDSALAEDENHGELGCHECHGGDPKDPNWKTAHKGVVKDPTYPDASKTCGACHEEIAENYTKSLHVTLSPFKKMIDKRASSDKAIHDKVNAAREGHCSSCHSSCGQCHISRPNAVEGGLLEGHLFQKQPPMQTVCTACHGSRIENEYFGKNKGIPPDVHKEKYFKCEKCHTADEMHGDGKDPANRYEVENGPKCLQCHKDIYDPKSANPKNHWIHKDQVSCQVCHSMPYKNCSSCHVGKDKEGVAYFKTKPSTMDFKVGLNPLRSEKRPEKFVTLRHVPVDQGTFDFYVKNGLANFDALPNWKFSTPHNIRRKTPQNENCNKCHGNPELFLVEKVVDPKEKKANKDVIVPDGLIPKKRAE